MTTTRYPVAYIRRSSPDESKGRGEASRDAQEQAIRELAHRDGHNGDVRYFTDWGRSADGAKLEKRTAYRDMLKAVERGEVSTIYAYALDRLHRDVIETGKLMIACRDERVRIVTQFEGEISDEDPAKWFMVTSLATQAEYALRVMKVRAKANMARRRERGDHIGIAPYGERIDPGSHKLVPQPGEDVEAVVDAYKRAGSFLGAAKLLTTEGRVMPRNGDHWSEQTVQRVVRRVMHVGKVEQGVKQRADWFLFRLLKCPHCGTTLTAQHRKNPIYFCNAARRDPRHPRPYAIAESKLIEWVKAEAARFAPSGKVPRTSNDALRAELEAAREALGWAVADRLLSREQAKTRAADLDAQLADLEAVEEAVAVPERIDWDRWDASNVNAVLRTYWAFVELDEQMQPVRADWRLPAEYLRP